MHQSSMLSMQRFKDKYLSNAQKKLKILDIGSQDIYGSYKDIFIGNEFNYTGADLAPGKNVDLIIEEPYNWKNIKSNSYDVVISGQAFEHIEYFWITMSEIERVLKPAGLCCLIAPSSGYEHKYPLDCWRIFPDGFNSLAKLFKFNIIESYMFKDYDKITDDSGTWQDSVIILEKPMHHIIDKIKLSIKNKIIKYTLI